MEPPNDYLPALMTAVCVGHVNVHGETNLEFSCQQYFRNPSTRFCPFYLPFTTPLKPYSFAYIVPTSGELTKQAIPALISREAEPEGSNTTGADHCAQLGIMGNSLRISVNSSCIMLGSYSSEITCLSYTTALHAMPQHQLDVVKTASFIGTN